MKNAKLKYKLIDCLFVLIFIIFMYMLNIPCFFKIFFDVECSGCGITRAYINLFRLNIKKAFELNPMFWSVPIVCVLYLFDEKFSKYKRVISTVLNLIYLGFIILGLYRIISAI